jgi:hypothetical protein
MLFASRAQGSPDPGGAFAAAREAVQLPAPATRVIDSQTGSPAASAGAIVAAAVELAERVSPAGGSSPPPATLGSEPTQPSSGGSEPPHATPAPTEAGGQPEAEEREPTNSGPQSHGPSAPQAPASGSNGSATPPSYPPPVGVATAAAVRAATGARRTDTSAAATASERERQAESALRLWAWSAPWREGAALTLFAPDLQRFIAEFESLARDITLNSAAEAPAKAAGAAAQELALVLTGANTPAVGDSSQGTPASARSGSSAALGSLTYAQRLAALASGASLDDALHGTQKTSVATSTAASPTVAGWLPSAAGAAFGSGMTGAAAPAAALLAVAAVCLLGTWLPRRLADDGLACKSALLNMRLERPG